MNDEKLKPLFAAILKVLKPLVRILLRNGVSYGMFADFAKWVYVEIANNEFCITGRKQSTSRVSIVTGLSRKEVKRVQQLPRPDDRTTNERYNRAARVIAAWRREPDYRDAGGKPASLPMTGAGSTFSELVKRFSGDMPARAIFDELERVGAAKRLKDGRVRLLTRSYVPEGSDADTLQILGNDVGLLISTIDHNLKSHINDTPFFQRKVAYDNLPDHALPQFRKLSAKKAQALLEKLDSWLAEHDRDVSPDIEGEGRNYAGLGIYYFERKNTEEVN